MTERAQEQNPCTGQDTLGSPHGGLWSNPKLHEQEENRPCGGSGWAVHQSTNQSLLSCKSCQGKGLLFISLLLKASIFHIGSYVQAAAWLPYNVLAWPKEISAFAETEKHTRTSRHTMRWSSVTPSCRATGSPAPSASPWHAERSPNTQGGGVPTQKSFQAPSSWTEYRESTNHICSYISHALIGTD